MKLWLGSLFQKQAHSPLRRAYFTLLPRFRAVFSKRQSVRFVRINGRRYKRVVFGDSYEAVALERALLQAPAGARFPKLIHRHENEVLLDFVEGRPFDGGRTDDRGSMARFLGALYATQRSRSRGDTLARQLEIDLGFLVDAGLVGDRLRERLAKRAAAVRPAEVEFGLDYVDPVEKNFVIAEAELYAIDVESLRLDVPIGTGVAKAAIHWLARTELAAFLADVEGHSGDVFRDQYPFVELCFRVGWTKRKLLQGKHASIRIELLEELLNPDESLRA
jgi:hypothetical protein